MIKKYVEYLKKPIFFSVIFTFFLLSVFLCTEPKMSVAGDINISEFLSSSGKIKSGYFFISPILGYVLRGLNSILTVNWWTFFSIGIMFLGIVVVLWFINKRIDNENWTVKLLISMFWSVFIWELILKYDINFTQTATISSITGFLFIADLCFEYENRTTKEKIVKATSAILFLLVSGSIRWKALALTLPFEIMSLLYVFVFPYSSSNILKSLKNSIIYKKHVLFYGLIIIITVLFSYGIREIYMSIDEDLAEYVKVNSLREDICDYADRYPLYNDDTEQMYRELDIKKSWIDMVNGFNTSDKNFFTVSKMEQMVKLKENSKKTVQEFVDTLDNHDILWLSLVLIISSVIILKGIKNSYIPIIACAFAYILCALYFIFIGRFVWRVTNCCILAGMISFWVMSSHTLNSKYKINIDNTAKTGIVLVSCLYLIIAIVAIREEKNGLTKPRSVVLSEVNAEVLGYIDSDEKNIYFYKEGPRFMETYNLWTTHKSDYLDNYFPLTSNFIYGCKDKLKECGVDDVYNDMLKKVNMRVVYTDTCTSIMYKYLQDYYDTHVTITVVDNCRETMFIRYTKPVLPCSYFNEDVISSFDKGEILVDNEAVDATFYVGCSLQESYEDVYINIKDIKTNETYSYGLNVVGKDCNGTIVCMKDTWDKDNIEVILLAKKADGNIAQLAILTEQFYADINND